jgi:hypothetical protein
MTRDELEKNYWGFYILLERKFEEITRYVELSEDNYRTYSLEFASLLREIGSEIDVIMKALCGIDDNSEANMKIYSKEILEKYLDICERKVSGRGIKITPFMGWSKGKQEKSLKWWNAYNSIKHGRVTNFKKANLKNVFYALGALCILNNYLLIKNHVGELFYDEYLDGNIITIQREKTIKDYLKEINY